MMSRRKKGIFFFQAEDGIRDYKVTGVQTCALPISREQIRSARRVEPAADFREGDRDEHRREPDSEDEQRAPRADGRGERGGHREDGAADDLIDANRGQVPSTELPD